MENRYLFRAKRTDTGEWVQGNLIQSCDATDGWESIIIPVKNSNMFTKHIGHGYGNLGFENWYRVNPSTICRCTESKDKNGKLIWENDIVKEFNSSGDEWNLSQIVFGEYSLNLGWCAKGIKTLHEYSRRLFNVGFGTSEAGKCEAIGNIFDNPELLKSEG